MSKNLVAYYYILFTAYIYIHICDPFGHCAFIFTIVYLLEITNHIPALLCLIISSLHNANLCVQQKIQEIGLTVGINKMLITIYLLQLNCWFECYGEEMNFFLEKMPFKIMINNLMKEQII